ncbi:proline--tRNA ligase [Mycobacterium sp.]|uniref:proline--tRNA ligase n=1 Tax=Mycobacterium sp. TaxID=1785 RepID=UPI002D63B72E|nr:proline--tRNA ligase [Mycobacterium sp.]HZA10244.1 proline--tRNA ligase [Mycobacterium sp.]
MAVLTPQHEDFPRWYQDVLTKAKLAENGPARGTMVIRPNGYAIWERMQAEIDARIKSAGAQNAYFPLLIPMSFFEREAEHVEGFSPELAVVTHGGGKELTEPLAIRPTSEAVIGEYMAKWVDSYRDLPLLLNQWANVVRWELRPRIFLRTTEFLWQEGHTAHAEESDARHYARGILHDVYRDFMRRVLAMPVIVGRKTAKERFAGAANTMTCEGIMRDGKALQMATSHELGQRFSRAFNISYSSAEGSTMLCWTTSWGASTRMLGGLIMCHGDDLGLVVPPALAPVQVVVVVVKDTDGAVTRTASALVEELKLAGVRVRLDDNVAQGFGRRATDWDLQGVPIRVELGPRDLAENAAVLYRRDARDKHTVSVENVVGEVQRLAGRVQTDMLKAATARRDALITDCATLNEAREVAQTGVARLPWELVGASGEQDLATSGLTVRCLQLADGSLPETEEDAGALAYVARAY